MPRVKVDGVSIYYEEYGEGTPLLLISGTGSSRHCWLLETVPRLKDEFRVIIFDLRGTGDSDKPDLEYSMQIFARDSVAVLDDLSISEPAHVLGWSMGGRIAQWLALDYPERVRSLVLACTGPGSFDDFVPIRGIPLRHALEMIEMGYEEYRKYYATSDFNFPKAFAETHPELMRRVVEKSAKDKTPLKCYLRHIIARQMHETYHLLDRIKAPTLVLEGAEDTVIRGTGNHVRGSQVLAERIPNARLELIPRCAHAIFYQEPELTHRIIADFLRAH